MSGETILEVEHVSKSFGGLKAVDDVSIALKRGHIFGLIGPNGSGKSTLFNIIAGTEKKDGGRVLFDGTPIDDLPSHKILELGLARSFQIPRLFFAITVVDHVFTMHQGRIIAEGKPGEVVNDKKVIDAYLGG